MMKTKSGHCITSSPIVSAKAVVSGRNAVTIRWTLNGTYPEPILRYKVEWSLATDFKEVEGVMLTSDVSKTEAIIRNLKKDLKYAFRVSAGLHWGFCVPCRTNPELVVVSSWEEVSGCKVTEPCDIKEIEDDFQKICASPLWQTAFPSTPEAQVKRKKSGLRTLFSSNTKFQKNIQKGLHLVTVILCEQKVLCTLDECLPVITVDDTNSSISKEDFFWALKLSLCWESMQIYNENRECSSASVYFRAKFIEAVSEMQYSLGVKNIGRLHPQLLSCSENGALFLASVMIVKESQIFQNTSVKWIAVDKLRRKHASAVDFLAEKVKDLVNFYEKSQRRLPTGLHLSYVKLHSSLDAVGALVPEEVPSMLPSVLVRGDPHVLREEWEWLRVLEEGSDQKPTRRQLEFNDLIVKACQDLFKILKIQIDLMSVHRLYRLQVVQIDLNTSIILLLPGVDGVCTAPKCFTEDVYLEESKRSCTSLLLPIFELIHSCVYNGSFLKRYTSLFLKIDHLYTVAQREQRNCLSDDDIQLYHAVLEGLKKFQFRLSDIWKNTRWLFNVVNEARSKQAKCTVTLEKLLKYSCSVVENVDDTTQESNNLAGSCENVFMSTLNAYLTSSDVFPVSDKRRPPASAVATSVVRVYAAYQCGFAKGTSVRMQITSSTTAREVVTLVVSQLTKAATTAKISKCEDVSLHDYCLVVVIGSRERRIRDDFPLLKLQNPWTKGKLFVRRRDRILGAVQFGNEASV